MKRWGGSAILLILLFLAPAVSASEVSLVRITTQKTEVQVGETFVATVRVEPTEPITGVEVLLSFDPEVLTITDLRYQGLLGANSFHVPASIDRENGRVLIAGTTLSGTTVSTPGDLAKITFRANKSGHSSLTVMDAKLVRAENRPEGPIVLYIPCTLENAEVNAVERIATGGSESLKSSSNAGGDIIIPLAAGILLLLALLIVLIVIMRIRYVPENTYFW